MIIIDGRTLSEPQPTGVTEVARQCIEHITSAFPNTKIVQASEHLSNSFTNFLLYSRLTTLEDIAHAPRDPKNIIFLPNTHFIHTRVEGARIQVVHDLSFLHAPQWYSPRMRAWHHATRAIESLHRADLLISVSEWTRQDLITHAKIPADRVVVVPPAAPEPHGGTRPQKLSFHDKPFFLFLGTLEKRKNIRGVIEAFELIKNIPELKNYQLVLAGRLGFGAPNTNKLPERVHHLSYISDSEKWWLLKHATALVYPSFFEGFGLPPLEAAAVGCPTIISDNTATAETMGNAALQVSPYDIKQIALAMKAIAIDRQLAVRCKMRGFERVAWYSKVRQSTALFSALDYASQLI